MTQDVVHEKRTSITDPLEIAEIKTPRITYGLTFLPGKKSRAMGAGDWDRDFDLDIKAILAWAPDVLITSSVEEERHLYMLADPLGIPEERHFHQPSPMSANLDESWIDRPSLEEFHAGIVKKSRLHQQRVLIISMRGLQRAGTLAGIFLRLQGASAEDAEFQVNAAKEYAISTTLQRNLIINTQAPPNLPAATPVRLRRDQQAPGLIIAKANAELRMVVSGEKKGVALEAIAKERGWKNWSTMSAALSSSGLPYPAHNRAETEIHTLLGLKPQTASSVKASLIDVHYGPKEFRDIWADRAVFWAYMSVDACFAIHALHGVQVGADALYECFTLDTFCRNVRAVQQGDIGGEAAEAVLAAAHSTPGFMIEKAVRLEPQPQKTSDAVWLLCAMTQKPLGKIIDNLRMRTDAAL